MILEVLAQNYAAVHHGRTLAGNPRPRRIAGGHDFPNASRGIIGGHSLDRWVACEESLALSERDRVRGNLSDALEGRARNADEVVHNRDDDLALDVQAARNQQIV